MKAAGLEDRYEEQAHGEHILLSIHTGSFEERELVQEILQKAGISELRYIEDSAA